jgi:peptidoglycan/LPS O-acetylase OafA/YrhL
LDVSRSPVSPPAGVRSSGFLPELEALRGVAALLVFAFHADRYLVMLLEVQRVNTRALVTTPWQAFIRSGDTGVTLFFVLSAFLLSLPFLEQARGGRRVQLGNYARRRALRILPLYWTLLAISALYLYIAGSGPPSAMLPYAVFANGIVPGLRGAGVFTGVVWSLATEAQFYVLLPLLPFVAARPRLAAVLLAVYAVAYAAWLARLLPGDAVTTFRVAHSVFGRGWVFLAGIGAAWVYQRHGPTLRARAAATPWLRNGGSDALLLVVLLALGMLLVQVLHVPGPVAAMPPHVVWHLPEGVLWALVVLIVLLTPLRVKPLLCNRALMGVGVLSYSIYLWHLPVLKYALWPLANALGMAPMGWTASGLFVFGVVFVLVLAGSTLTYNLIERPFLRRKERVGV